jgi:hypothetical protein
MDELGKSFPAAEGLVDAEQGGKKIPTNEYCLNCGTKLQDFFCHHCGQKDIPRRQTLGELFSNFISSFWSYEGKFFLTTKYLITKPGFLTVEYNNGKRESYYHPARMYVFISFLFFLLLFSLPDSNKSEGTVEMSEEDLQELKSDLKDEGIDSIALDSTINSLMATAKPDSSGTYVFKGEDYKKAKKKGSNFSFTGQSYKSVKEYDSAQALLPMDKRDGWFGRTMNRRTSELNDRYKDDTENFGEDFKQAFLDNFSKVLFYLLPIFALLLKLFYIRRDYFYSEHLVFSIYYYNFFYIAASLMLLFDLVPWLSWLSTLTGFWIFFYLLFAMKRMYAQSWLKTIVKFGLFSFVFMFFLGIGLGISALAVLLMI